MRRLLLLLIAGTASAQWYSEPPRETVVAVIDSGVDCSQFDCVPGWDFVDNDATPYSPGNPHGTNTAGILVDLAEHVKIMPLRVLNDAGISTEQQLIDAVNFARDNGAHLIQGIILVSSAWGIPNYDQPGQLQGFCNAIASSGLLYIGVTGNEGVNLDNVTRYPPACSADNMIMVAGTDQADTVFTSWPGDINAPGNGINLRTGGTGSGASYAAPQVTATAVIEYQTNPELDAQALRTEVLEHVGPNAVLNTFYPPQLVVPPDPTLVLDITATINISDINLRNPIQSKQGDPERGYVFEVPAGSAPRVLTLESWPPGASSPIMVRGTTVLQEGVTYQVRVTHDGTTARLYLDGSLDGQLVTPPPRSNAQPVRQCRYRWSASYDRFFNGSCQVQ